MAERKPSSGSSTPRASLRPRAHKTKIKQQQDEKFEHNYGGMFIAVCSCGFESEPRSKQARAEAEADRHQKENT